MSIEQLKAAYMAATAGKWFHIDGTIYGNDNTYLVCDVVGNPEDGVNEQDQHNIEFIALAHNTMPKLLEALTYLREAHQWMIQHIDQENASENDEALEVGISDFLEGLS